MGDTMKHEHGWSHGGSPWAHGTDMPAFFIPIPMAFFGVLISFMFGFTVGSMAGKKQAMSFAGSWRKHAMGPGGMGHHHHGEGTPACRKWHGDSPGAPEGIVED